MSSGTDTDSSGTNTNSSGADISNSGANVNSFGTNTNFVFGLNPNGPCYEQAAILSGLAASVAAQLYSSFQGHPTIAIITYCAVALNLVAAMSAFILIDWKAKRAASKDKDTYPSELMLRIGHLSWFGAFYFGLSAIILPAIGYTLITTQDKLVVCAVLTALIPGVLLLAVHFGAESSVARPTIHLINFVRHSIDRQVRAPRSRHTTV